MKLQFLVVFTLALLLSACSAPVPKPVAVQDTGKEISYLKDVKPILDKRCVTCHSCYNSPCQAKMSSFEGVDRGASKLLVYDALRFRAVDPTRLFIDAKDTKGWRKKEFYSVTQGFDSNTTHNDSIMMHLLYDKKMNPEVIGRYSPEHDDLICPRDKKELGEYLSSKPNHGMPYGLPALEENEYQTLAQWLHRGAYGPSKEEQILLKKPSEKAAFEIKKWETFLNKTDTKHRVTARYLYEHLYLGHIYFDEKNREFFELVRSYTPPGYPIEVIPTVRPLDDPLVKHFYYRISKIHSTIVHKTHMTIKFDDTVLARYKELFIDIKWMSEPTLLDYNSTISANPLVAFNQIPAASRYQFLLDNSHYIIMNFIRGPVCRGQMALNVIHDHFWIMFKDPAFDVTVIHPELLNEQAANLKLPIESVDKTLFKAFSDDAKDAYAAYYDAKFILIKKDFPNGMPIESIWKGNKATDTPLLTIYRHFDSASVHKGVLGEKPRTMWVINFAQLEKIYYTLVAGYNVFGNLSHQTRIRRYTDFLRLEGELNFMEYMPTSQRVELLKSWYIQDEGVKKLPSLEALFTPTAIEYSSDVPMEEFISQVVEHHILKSTNIHFDHINYIRKGDEPPTMPKEFHTYEDYKVGARSVTQAGSGFIKHMTDKQANNIYVRVNMPDGTFRVSNVVINRWHDNVNSLFNGDSVLNSNKDTMDILHVQTGSYPNGFAVIDFENLDKFLHLMKYMTGTKEDIQEMKKYFISRSDKRFWEIFDWFQNYVDEEDYINGGLLDLNRYAREPWEMKE